MIYVTNGRLSFGVADENCLSPFLANGYKVVEPVPVVESKAVEVVEEKVIDTEQAYTKTDILRMSLESLKALAISVGIEVKTTDTGAYLKKVLIDKLVK